MNRILITGGCGFLGSNLARRLLAKGHKVALFDLTTDLKNIENIQDRLNLIIQGDLAVASDVENAFRATKLSLGGLDTVFHLGSQVSHIVSQQDPYRDLKTNCIGTVNVLEAVKNLCPEAHVIYACSRSVYGKQDVLPIRERAPTNPVDNYGITKLTAEKYCLLYHYHYGTKATSLRMANLFGPYQVLTPVYQFIAYVFFCVMSERPFTFYGDGTQTRDFLYVGDACQAYIDAMETPEKSVGEIFNLGGLDYCSWNKAIEIAEEVTGKKAKVEYIEHTPLRAKLENPHSKLDYGKILSALDWQPRTSLREGFGKMLPFYGEHERWKRYLAD